MKILLTTDAYYPMVNGVVTSTHNLYTVLKSQGHDVRILALSNTFESYKENDVYYLKSIGVWVYPDARISADIKNVLLDDIIEWGPDIVHSQTEFSTMRYARRICNKLQIPQIHTYHTMYEDYLKYFLRGKIIRKSELKKILRWLLNKMDEIIVPTEKVEEVLRGYGVYKHIAVIPTGLDLSKFNKEFSFHERNTLRESLGVKPSEKLMVYVGRLGEEKNIEEIIANYKEILQEFSNVKLAIVGGGPYLSVLENAAEEMNIKDRIIFTGMVEPENVYKYYKIGDVFVTASTSETQGLTYIEALSSGVPVICRYDQCIDNVVVDGYNGYSYKTQVEFLEYSKKVLMDDDFRSVLSRNALSRANNFSKEVFGEKVYDEYISLTESSYSFAK